MKPAFNAPTFVSRWTPSTLMPQCSGATLPISIIHSTPSIPYQRAVMVINTGVETPAEPSQTTQFETPPTPTTGFGFSNTAFVDAVSGEWFGYECSFSVRDGSARNIPERYVPDEFRNWGVEINGFDSLTSTKLLPDESLLMKRTRALPSVGCEADAVVPEVKDFTFPSVKDNAVNGGFADGTVVCGPATITENASQRWHVCLVDPAEGVRSRVRLEFGLVDEPFGAVVALLEHWEAPFCGGEVLPGCGGTNSSFATDDALDVGKELGGKWNVRRVAYNAGVGGWEREDYSFVVQRDEAQVHEEVNVAMPRGMSVGIRTDADGTKTVVAGWKAGESQRVVSRSVYAASGALVSVYRDLESKQD